MARYTTCDKCGKVLKGMESWDNPRLTVELNASRDGSSDGFYCNRDLCSKCAKIVNSKLNFIINVLMTGEEKSNE